MFLFKFMVEKILIWSWVLIVVYYGYLAFFLLLQNFKVSVLLKILLCFFCWISHLIDNRLYLCAYRTYRFCYFSFLEFFFCFSEKWNKSRSKSLLFRFRRSFRNLHLLNNFIFLLIHFFILITYKFNSKFWYDSWMGTNIFSVVLGRYRVIFIDNLSMQIKYRHKIIEFIIPTIF